MRLSVLLASVLCFVLLHADHGFGQAIVGYGINVGRAGAAGAGAGAAGAGAAGIFKKLGDRMDADSNASGQRTARTGQPEFDPQDLEKAKAEREKPAFTNGGTMKTESGFTISGLSSPKASPTRVRYAARPYNYMPAGPGVTPTPPPSPAVAAEPTPAAGDAPDAQPAPTAAAPVPRAATDVGESARGESDAASVLEARRSGSAPSDVSSDTGLTPEVRRLLEVDSEIADIAMGTPIQDLVARFGKPLFKMAGLAGQGYNEKYIFRAPDGRRFTVFAQDGAVAEIMIEPAEIAAL